VTHYYWNDCAMGNDENGFIQEESELLEGTEGVGEAGTKGFWYIGEGECLDDALSYCRERTPEASLWRVLENPRFLAAIERDYE
jgi:hypothetical protein